MDQHETATTDVAGVKKSNGEREPGRNGCINSIATASQNVLGNLRGVFIGYCNCCPGDCRRLSGNGFWRCICVRRTREQC